MAKSEEHFSIREGLAYARGEYVNKSSYKSNIASRRRIKMRKVIIGSALFLGIVSTSFGADMGEILCGELQQAAITEVGQEDTWTFNGQAGDKIIISAQKTDGSSLWPHIVLLDLDNNKEIEADKYLEHTLARSGDYKIVIHDGKTNHNDLSYNHAGQYNVIFWNLSACPIESIECDQVVSLTLDVAELDVFNFSGQAGDKIIISAQKTDGSSLWPHIVLLDLDNNKEIEADKYLEHTLARSGDYKIVIHDGETNHNDLSYNHAGQYNIIFWNLSACPIESIECDQVVSLTLDIAELDVFRFNGQAGDEIIISAQKTDGSSLWPHIVLFDLDNNKEIEADKYLEHTLARSGDYKIVIHDGKTNDNDLSYNHAGDYNITLDCNGPSPGGIIYVDDTAEGANDGTSWVDAYNHLQDALADSSMSQLPCEIKVAQGIYTPDRSTTNPQGTGDRTATFQLVNDVIIEGGYAGIEGDDPDVRDEDMDRYLSILSGDLLGNDILPQDPCELPLLPSRADNSYHVITASYVDANTVLDGFIVASGNANGPNREERRGAGLYNLGSHLIVRNCTFVDNSTGGVPGEWDGGAGMHNREEAKPTISHCTFIGNHAKWDGGGLYNINSSPMMSECYFESNTAGNAGGAVYLINKSDGSILSCIFVKNSAQRGGAVRNSASSPSFDNCVFTANWTEPRNFPDDRLGGGAVANNSSSSPKFTRCLFSGNRSTGEAGAILSKDNTILTLGSCTLHGNQAISGGAISFHHQSELNVTDSILWENIPEDILAWDNEPNICYSTSQDGWECEGNLNIDPLFAHPGYWADSNDLLPVWIDGDYHLRSRTGRWDPVDEIWVLDEEHSPCIDTGDPEAPWEDEPQPNGRRINMGVYGGTSQASMSWDQCSLDLSSSEGGSVSVPGEGTSLYDCGERAEVNAVAEACYEFTVWTGTAVDAKKVDDPDDPHTLVTVDGDYTLIANFAATNYELCVSSTDGGRVIQPEEGCKGYSCGEEVALKAVADPCYRFTHWSGTAVEAGKVADDKAPTTTVAVDADYTLMAHFELHEYQLTISYTGCGSTMPGDGVYTYDCNTIVPMRAVPDECCRFVRWTGTAVDSGKVDDSTDPDITVIVDADYTLIANFELVEYEVTVSSTEGGSVPIPGEETFTYACNTSVPVSATPEAYYQFTHWTGTAVDAGKVADINAASTTVMVDADYTLRAHFGLQQCTLSISSGSGGSVTTPGEGDFVREYNTSVPVEATADVDCRFDKWVLTRAGSNEPVDQGKLGNPNDPATTVLVDGDYTLQALFICPVKSSTYGARSITSTSAVLKGGVVSDEGEPCQYRYRYWAEGGPEQITAWKGSVVKWDIPHERVSGLVPNTTYYFVLELRNSVGQDIKGNPSRFTTLAD